MNENLESIFIQYFKDIREIRANNMDLSNVEFHKQNELKIKLPEKWEVQKTLISAISKCSSTVIPNIYVLYSDTNCYDNFRENAKLFNLSGDLKYGSYFELFHAISSNSQDIRPQKRIKNDIESSTIVIVLDSSRCPDIVIGAVRQFANECLVLLD